ncbi:alpha/beta fold hydrolase [Streptomyces sp. NPDC001054]
MRAVQVTAAGDRVRWIEIPGAARPARVYVHGLGAASGPYFTEVALHPALAGHRSLLVDLPGHGISDRPTSLAYTMEEHADFLARALEAAGVRGADVVGHSMGGTVAVLLAARHPHLVGRLVLVDANLDPVRPEAETPGSSGLAALGEEEFLAGAWRGVRDRAGAHWWATMRLAGREALHRSAVHLARTEVRGVLTRLAVPRAYLHPEADGPVAGAEALRAAGVTLRSVPDCGHNIMLDNPEGFARVVGEFFGN